MYLYYLLLFIYKEKQQLKDIEGIIKIIQNLSNKNFSKVIKIYILKLFFNLMDNNFEQFQNYNFFEDKINFINEFKETAKENKDERNMLSHFFLPSDIEDYKKYENEQTLFLQSNFDPNKKEIIDLIEKDGIDIFLCLSINKVISNLCLNRNEAKEIYNKFSVYINSILNNNNEFKKKKN